MTSPRLQAFIDQGAARVREICSDCEIDLRDPKVALALRLLLLDVNHAVRLENPLGAISVVVDYWLDAIPSP